MLLYITRKNSPSIGGMQRFNQKLIAHLAAKEDFRLISWGRSQLFMPAFLLFAFGKALLLGLMGKIDRIYLSDGLMSPLGLLLKKILNVPVAVNIHGRDIAFNFPGYLTVVPAALRRLDRVICVSGDLKKICRGYGVPENILRVVPNGVDIEDFTVTDKTTPPRSLGIDGEGRVILITVGRLVPKKGVDRFIADILPELVERDPRLLYLVVGDGPLREKIEGIIAEKGLEKHVRMMGNVGMDDGSLTALYGAADIFVMPNALVEGDIEGFGIVAIEGGAAGLPVVAARLQGIKEAIADGQNGILLEWNDRRAFIDTIADLAADPEKRKKLGARAREYVKKHYSWETIADRYREIFSRLK